ncbi:Tetratricopeptide repeat-containing protein [Saccharicrinis carchari]|uniref:Tetratricopeptide repeat-containing protein n=1 Tax=Saccharicrinis carchari TaxID=1168039 RepID=A0A521DK37_SACCC|nr:tetratricopeptide repeat protein [Saccharicrinis carchari]SMO71290.1 Tetratricopeptide repeat-containing protein [Saccharicrinis carchari]
MQKIFILLLSLFWVTSMSAQQRAYKKEILKAEDLLQLDNYQDASAIYNRLLKEYPNDRYILFKAGECFLFSENHIEKSIELLEEAVQKYPLKNKKSTQAIEARFYLGQAYHLGYRFAEALELFEKLKKQIASKQSAAKKKIQREIIYNKNALALKKHPVDFRITNLGPFINTKYDEHSPVVNLHEDMLLFTSTRKPVASATHKAATTYENVYFSHWRDGQWITSRGIGFNTQGNSATIGISSDGSTLLIYKSEAGVGNIHTSYFKNNNWGELEKLPSPINTMANETHASFSIDGNTLYFTSDRAGGYGGKDIYCVNKLPDGSWGKVRNMGEKINTEYDEESPYIHPNGKTLYFSSEGHRSMGGYDIFKAGIDTAGNWGNVLNIGYPINTPFDDLFYAPTIDEQRVYYASRRDKGFGGADIYLIEFPSNHPNALTVAGGFLFRPDGEPAANAKITVTNKNSGEVEGVYRPSPNNGKYIFILPAGAHYNMEIEMEGHKTVIKDFNIPAENTFARKKHTFYLDPLVLKVNTNQ